MKAYIEFPYMNLKFFVDRVAFYIGAKPVYWYGLIIALGLVVAAVTAIYLGRKNQVSSDTILDIVLWGIPSAIICARAYYVIFNFKQYALNPLDIFKIWNGGIAIYGAIIGAVISTALYCRIKKINTLKVMDVGSIGLVIGQIIGRWGNFFNQEAFGTNTTLPWAMSGSEIVRKLNSMKNSGLNVDPSLPVHPTFLYESLWNVLVLGLLLVVFLKFRKYDGKVFWIYILSYGFGRLWIEGLRTDSLYIGIFRISQLVAIFCIIFGLIMLIYNNIRIKNSISS